ncbi:MAG: hypothetical protein OHK0024_21440 [Thalassobaculales bacterium]
MTAFSVFDIDTVTLADEGVWMTLEHPVTGEALLHQGRPVRLKVLGGDGRRFEKISAELETLQRDLMVKARGRVHAAKTRQITRQGVARAIIDWENVTLPGGEPLSLTEANALRLCTELPWLYDQVDRFISDRAHFMNSPAMMPAAG